MNPLYATATGAMNLVPLRYRTYSVVTGLANTPISLKRPDVAITLIDTVTWNADPTKNLKVTAAGHRLQAGDVVTFAGFQEGWLNRMFTVASVLNANVFFVKPTKLFDPLAAPASYAAAVLQFNCQAQIAIVQPDPNNATDISFGPDTLCDWKTKSAGTEYELDTPRGAKIDAADWYAKSANANQTIRVLLV